MPIDEATRARAFAASAAAKPGGAAAEDDQVVERLGLGIFPMDGPHAAQQIFFVVGGLGRLGAGDGHGYSHPPLKPARRTPLWTEGHRRIRSQMIPLR